MILLAGLLAGGYVIGVALILGLGAAAKRADQILHAAAREQRRRDWSRPDPWEHCPHGQPLPSDDFEP